eukprot:m.24307 g.24307  ORF g.24307 m.24307 type:complete len:1241 (+) comp8588_c0_seq1:191-3913(+)
MTGDEQDDKAAQLKGDAVSVRAWTSTSTPTPRVVETKSSDLDTAIEPSCNSTSSQHSSAQSSGRQSNGGDVPEQEIEPEIPELGATVDSRQTSSAKSRHRWHSSKVAPQQDVQPMSKGDGVELASFASTEGQGREDAAPTRHVTTPLVVQVKGIQDTDVDSPAIASDLPSSEGHDQDSDSVHTQSQQDRGWPQMRNNSKSVVTRPEVLPQHIDDGTSGTVETTSPTSSEGGTPSIMAERVNPLRAASKDVKIEPKQTKTYLPLDAVKGFLRVKMQELSDKQRQTLLALIQRVRQQDHTHFQTYITHVKHQYESKIAVCKEAFYQNQHAYLSTKQRLMGEPSTVEPVEVGHEEMEGADLTAVRARAAQIRADERRRYEAQLATVQAQFDRQKAELQRLLHTTSTAAAAAAVATSTPTPATAQSTVPTAPVADTVPTSATTATAPTAPTRPIVPSTATTAVVQQIEEDGMSNSVVEAQVEGDVTLPSSEVQKPQSDATQTSITLAQEPILEEQPSVSHQQTLQVESTPTATSTSTSTSIGAIAAATLATEASQTQDASVLEAELVRLQQTVARERQAYEHEKKQLLAQLAHMSQVQTQQVALPSKAPDAVTTPAAPRPKEEQSEHEAVAEAVTPPLAQSLAPSAIQPETQLTEQPVMQLSVPVDASSMDELQRLLNLLKDEKREIEATLASEREAMERERQEMSVRLSSMEASSASATVDQEAIAQVQREKQKLELALQEAQATFAKEKEALESQVKAAEAEGQEQTTAQMAAAEAEKTQLREQMAAEADEFQKLRAKMEQQITELNAANAALVEKYQEAQAAAQESLAVVEHATTLEKENALMTKQLKEIQVAFDKERVERKKAKNALEDLKGNIRVYCRVRPLSKSELEKQTHDAIELPDEYTIYVHEKTKHEFTFDRVFGPQSTQEEVYTDTGSLIQSAIDGYPVCIFAYGQTSAGKSFTMIGDSARPMQHPGLAPRAFQEIFNIIDRNKSRFDFTVSCQMVELYKTDFFDLLAPPDSRQKLTKVLPSRAHGMMEVVGASDVTVGDPQALYDHFERGAQSRHVSSTKMNAESSRSHLILNITIRSQSKSSKAVQYGRLSLVDLAGSETPKKTGATGSVMSEGTAINKSLTLLNTVIQSASKKNSHIPYRDHPLTYLMKDSIGGKAKTLMFVNLSPSSYNAAESLNSLRFAERAKKVTNTATKGSQQTARAAEIEELKSLVSRLHKGEEVADDEVASAIA